ncbi:MAG TPA: hypothetical protein VFU50_13535 [Terriglobales bacterium]|nr:hypothetical protein [Terriglobales bacterium]
MNSRSLRFEIHRAQKIAAAFLVIFLIQSLWLAAHLPLTMAETRNALAGEALWSQRQLSNARSPLIPGDSILTLRCAGFLPSIARWFQQDAREFSIYAAPNRWLVRLPFVFFGLWLGGALWWVARRLFGDSGGYIALALYCFSPPILLASATVDSAILASWGLFGLVFTAIGVAHTLYAPAEKWRPRIILLGVAIGLTAAASVSAAIAGLAIGGIFMFYLAPGRRLHTLGILLVSCAIGVLILLACFGFNFRDVSAAALLPNSEYLALTSRRMRQFLSLPGGLLEVLAFLSAVFVLCLWSRSRYFGNLAALLVAIVVPWWPGQFSSASALRAVPFALVFVGGIYADLLEPRFFAGRFHRLVAATAFVLVGASAVLSVMVVTSSS